MLRLMRHPFRFLAARWAAQSSEPLKPEQVARAVVQLIRKPRPEICLPSSERFLAEFLLWFPKLADALKPTLVSIGKRRMAAYLATSAQDEHKASLRGSS